MSTEALGPVMTAEEFYQWGLQDEYENKHLELVHGRPVIHSLPGQRHGFVCAQLGTYLSLHGRSERNGYTCLGAGFIACRNPDCVLAPDVTFYNKVVRYEDLPREWTEEAPHFAIEVRDHEEALDYLLAKAAIYLRVGMAEVWIADPEDKTITVHRNGTEPHRFKAGQRIACAAPALEGFALDVLDAYCLPWERKRRRRG